MRPRNYRLAFLCLAFLLAAPGPVSAFEILELHAGSIVNAADGGAASTFDLRGPRVSIATFGQTLIPAWGFRACSGMPSAGCDPGNTLQVGGGPWLGGDFVDGSATLDGITHPGLGNAGVFFDQLYLTVTGTARVPELGTASTGALTGSFLLDGIFYRRSEPPFPDMVPDVTWYTLRGQGTFTVSLHRISTALGDAWMWGDGDSAVFALQPTPTPEPATLLLWGTGAAGLGVARWLKRRRSRRPVGELLG